MTLAPQVPQQQRESRLGGRCVDQHETIATLGARLQPRQAMPRIPLPCDREIVVVKRVRDEPRERLVIAYDKNHIVCKVAVDVFTGIAANQASVHRCDSSRAP